jgi:hypothetical protein
MKNFRAKKNDIIFYFSFPGGPVVEFAKALVVCVVWRGLLIGSNPNPRYALIPRQALVEATNPLIFITLPLENQFNNLVFIRKKLTSPL